MERLVADLDLRRAHEPGTAGRRFHHLDIAAKPLILVRHTDGAVRVLMNRCAHKGTKVVYDFAGNAGKTFRCPYHAWTYRTDGTLLNVPLKRATRARGSPRPRQAAA